MIRLITFMFLLPVMSEAQNILTQGEILDSGTREPLPGVSIIIFQSRTVTGGISNRDGKFNLNHSDPIDSVKFSAIGYHSLVLKTPQLTGQNNSEYGGFKEV
jgi:hypothetical protein